MIQPKTVKMRFESHRNYLQGMLSKKEEAQDVYNGSIQTKMETHLNTYLSTYLFLRRIPLQRQKRNW